MIDLTKNPDKSRAGSYIIDDRSPGGSIVVAINEHGFVEYCDDREQLAARKSPGEPHVGAKRQYFQRGFGGGLFVAPKFFETARKLR